VVTAGERIPDVDFDAVPWLTVADMREVDRLMTEELGVSLVRMMENAGRNLALLARRLLEGSVAGRRILVLAGRGGNGGGGLVAARHLAAAGSEVEVRLSRPPNELIPAGRDECAILGRIGVPVEVGLVDWAEPELVLDALLGYSQEGTPPGTTAQLIESVAGRSVLSLDVPSGLELSTGELREPFVSALATLTLALPKTGLRAPDAATAVLPRGHLGSEGRVRAARRRVWDSLRRQHDRSPLAQVGDGGSSPSGACSAAAKT
jgi:NAD(P)H-hydrate epimerase